MTGPSDKVTNEPHQKSLPLRDLWLLPVISILTALLMLSASEVIARELWPAAEKDACGNSKGPPGRFLANCKSRVKTPEGPWVDNAYNDCGYRSAQSCGTKKQGTTRIAVLGTSFAYGYLVPYASVYSTLESQSLTRRCGRPVEVQNVTSPGVDMLNVYRRTNEALALRPDLLILVVMSTDVRRDLSKEQLAHRDDPPGSEADQRRPVQGEGFLKRVVVNPIKESRSAYMLQHFMYQDPKTYMRLYLNYGDSGDFYKASSSPATQKHLSDFDVLLREIAQKAQAASVPMLILIGPAAAAVAIENSDSNPQFSADAFTEKISSIASNYRIPVIDPTPRFKGVSNSMSLFYIVDGHLNASGQVLVAQALDQELLSGKYPIFAGCQSH